MNRFKEDGSEKQPAPSTQTSGWWSTVQAAIAGVWGSTARLILILAILAAGFYLLRDGDDSVPTVLQNLFL